MGNSLYFGRKDVLAGKQYRTGTLGRALKDVYGDVDQAIQSMEALHSHMVQECSSDFCQKSAATLPLPWKASTPTGTASGDYVTGAAYGQYTTTLEATDEPQEAGLDYGNEKLIRPALSDCVVEMGVTISPEATLLAAETSILIGLGSDYDATWDDIADHCAFNIAGGGLVASVDHDDGTTDASVAAAFTFVKDQQTRLIFDMRKMAAVDVYAGAYGAKPAKVASALDMSGMAVGDGLQPLMYIKKTGETSVDHVSMDYCKVWAVGRNK